VKILIKTASKRSVDMLRLLIKLWLRWQLSKTCCLSHHSHPPVMTNAHIFHISVTTHWVVVIHNKVRELCDCFVYLILFIHLFIHFAQSAQKQQ